jgi:uncharacterized caspase-like protein
MKYQPRYNQSKALIVGINKYRNAPPLNYAAEDAHAIANLLKEKYGFRKEDITHLKDDDASKNDILEAFHKYTQDGTSTDDRLLIFFAGHGHTISGNRGETGFLVPVDGNPVKTATLIRWDELTRNSELIKAKHILFIMDACYGGLAISRALPTGTKRFLKDMCQRMVRQVLAAGKANEVVSDSGGPIPGHSVFTGHLIEALEGKAETENGIITANGVMAYVYNKVANDQHSRQTPHYGFIDGDGDFIFKADILQELSKKEEEDNDVLVSIPATFVDDKTQNDEVVQQVKEYIGDDRFRIKLDDLVVKEIRKVLNLTSSDNFPLSMQSITPEDIVDRLSKYEKVIKPLCAIISLLCYWGNERQSPLIQKIVSRIAEANTPQSGSEWLVNLRWYPIYFLLYTGGISSIAAEKYQHLVSLLTAPAPDPEYRGKTQTVVVLACDAMSVLNDVFKKIPGHEKNYVPISEYMFKRLQPDLEDLLLLGNSYEHLFDTYELLQMLVFADLLNIDRGPIGRFGWKHSRRRGTFVKDFMDDASKQGNRWPPIQAGLFKSDIERFKAISEPILSRLNELNWW